MSLFAIVEISWDPRSQPCYIRINLIMELLQVPIAGSLSSKVTREPTLMEQIRKIMLETKVVSMKILLYYHTCFNTHDHIPEQEKIRSQKHYI